jgi:hypothetical protein
VAIRIRAAAGWKKLSQPCWGSIARLLRRPPRIFLRGFGTKLEFLHSDLSRLGIQENFPWALALIKVMTDIYADRMKEENAASFVRTRFKMSYP